MEQTILDQVIHKVPGEPVIPKKEKQGYVELHVKSEVELQELIERQDKLLKNKSFLCNLPDKGAKIINFRKELLEELEKRQKSDDLSKILSRLNIGKEALEKLEWMGKCNPGQMGDHNLNSNEIESDDESADPLRIIATHSGTAFNKKIHKTLKPDEPLIKQSDIDTMEHKECDDYLDDPYAKSLCEKFDNVSVAGDCVIKEKFLPYKSVKPREKKHTVTKNNPKWEVTAATPPPAVFSDTKLISLHDSVKLQVEQAQKLKEVQMRHAREKLKSTVGKDIGTWEVNSDKQVAYRNPGMHYDSSDDSDDEDDKESFHSCNEEEEEERGGVVFYNIIDN